MITARLNAMCGASPPTTGLNASRTPVAASTTTTAKPYRQTALKFVAIHRAGRRALLKPKGTFTSYTTTQASLYNYCKPLARLGKVTPGFVFLCGALFLLP
jgi:hypothetical protein